MSKLRVKLFFSLLIILFLPVCLFSQTTVNFNYSGNIQSFVVPSCVSTITVELKGAQGGAAGVSGAAGGGVRGVISVTPGQVFYLAVGGQGGVTSGGYNGGGSGGGLPATAYGAGGGGATDIRFGGTGLTNRILVAGGGGGSGGNTTYNPVPGIGGGGQFCSSPYGYGGQAGSGCATGGDGGCAGGSAPAYGTGGAGGGLTSGGAVSGGTVPVVDGVFGTAGSLGFGGNGGNEALRNGGGGGGGGYYGGAGGMSGAFGCNGGGGGGSSYANDLLFSSLTFSAGINTGNGFAQISYYLFMPPVGAVSLTNCAGAPVTLTAASANGYTWSTGANSQNISVSPLGNTSYTAMSVNGLGCVTSTIYNVATQTVPVIGINTLSTSVYIGDGQTAYSSFAPSIYPFSDPLPSGARITKMQLVLSAVDQGWGGTGCNLDVNISGIQMGYPTLSHSLQQFTLDYNGAAPGYTVGGSNYLSVAFCGWGGWQSFFYGANLVIYYDMPSQPVCNGSSLNLTATGGNTYVWTGGISNGVPFTPAASGWDPLESTCRHASLSIL